MKTLTTLFIICLLFFSCQKKEEQSLLGTWVKPQYNTNATEYQFEKADNFLKNEYGVSFLKNNIFIERHTGWCGTPPLHYSNYEGTWAFKDSIITINIIDSNGKSTRYWKVKSVTPQTLIVERNK